MSTARPDQDHNRSPRLEVSDEVRGEIEFARAVTAVILAVKLNIAEEKAQVAYERVAGTPGFD